jgi:hypothetical protein
MLALQVLGCLVIHGAFDISDDPHRGAIRNVLLGHLRTRGVGVLVARQVDEARAGAQHRPRAAEYHLAHERPLLRAVHLRTIRVDEGVEASAQPARPLLLAVEQRTVRRVGRQRRGGGRAALHAAFL